jgi:hypothetical protein
MTRGDTVVVIWFAVSAAVEIVSRWALLLVLRRRGVRIRSFASGLPGYPEWVYAEWCNQQGVSPSRVLWLRRLSMINAVASLIALMGTVAGKHSP